MTYHIIVTNNRTGTVLVDRDTDALVAIYDVEEGNGIFQGVNCNTGTLAALTASTLTAAKELLIELPRGLRKQVFRAVKSHIKNNKSR